MKALILFFSLLPMAAFGGDQENFRFRFAYEKPQPGETDQFIYLQAESGTEATIRKVCGPTGASCACEFLNEAGKVVGTSKPADLRYEDTGNYFRCLKRKHIQGAAKARLIDVAGRKLKSLALPIRDTLDLGALFGRDLDINRARLVYRYYCEHTYLQKQGTTTQSFDCSNQLASCDPDGNSYNNFCLLKSRFPYYLYSDTYSTNFHQKIADTLYNVGGSGRICGLQIKKYDCVGSTSDAYGMPRMSFGLYGERVGYWSLSVSLPPGPELFNAQYGYAAPVSITTGECPPGLEKRVFHNAAVVTSDIFPSHNFTSDLLATEVADPSARLNDFEVVKVSGGGCGYFDQGTTCSMPTSYAGAVKRLRYSQSGQSEFCVIPPSLLP